MEKIFELYDVEAINRLAQIIKENKLSEITLVDGDKKLSIKGRNCPPPPMGMPPLAVPTGTPIPAVAAASEPEPASQPAAQGTLVKAPLVGTYYNAPSPESEPFVTVGKSVKKGDVLMIIESMKLMNEVLCDTDGTVAEILVANGDAVEFDQPLLRLV